MSAIHILNEKLSTRGGRYDGSLYTMQRFPSVDIWQYCFQSGSYPLVSLLYIRAGNVANQGWILARSHEYSCLAR